MNQKPRLSWKAYRLLCRISAYAKIYITTENSARHGLRNCASDVMDGEYRNEDKIVKELIRQKILVRESGTWGLTPLGCRLVLPQLAEFAWHPEKHHDTQLRTDDGLRVDGPARNPDY